MYSLTSWILTEGIAGTENQCLGVAEALGVNPDIKRVGLRFPWNILPPQVLKTVSFSFIPDLKPPWPDLLIAAGRKSVPASLYIKKQSKGKTFTVQLQNPRIHPGCFDLVAVPHHDSPRGENVIVTCGAPNRITSEKLKEEGGLFVKTLGALPGPKVAVMIGGKSKAYKPDKTWAKNLVTSLESLRRDYGCSLMMTASRRSGEDVRAVLKAYFTTNTNCFMWDGEGRNPYFAFLAWADFILVTGDSVSMLSDACTTGKPVYRLAVPGRGSKRLENFHKHLENRNACLPFEGILENRTYTPLNDSSKVARKICERFPGLECDPGQ